MKNKRFSAARIFGLSVAAILTAKADPPSVLFHCPFDGDIAAKQAAGPDFGVAREEDYVAGKNGRALRVNTGTAGVFYIEPGNLDKARGSIEVWIQPGWEKGDTGRQTFFQEEGEDDIGMNSLWLWKYEESLRFDVRDPEDSYATTSIADWEPGQWHHVVANWDCEKGLELYIDGELRRQRNAAWKPRPRSRFFVGNRPPQGDQPAQSALDELVIYANPLSADEVALAFKGELKRVPAPSRPAPKSGASASDKAPKLIFHLPFDGQAAASVAGGPAEPLEEKGLTYEPGLFGQAARFAAGSRLRFGEKGNLTKERGTISLWFRPDFGGGQTSSESGGEIWRTLFREGPSPDSRIGSSQLWLWLFGPRMRFDVADPGDSHARAGISEWKGGEWHHLACTWDHRGGRTLYIDGEPVAGGSDKRKPFLTMSWDVEPFDFFQIGGDDGGRPADGRIEDLRIYDAPLSAKGVRGEFGRVFPVSPAASRVHYAVGKPGRLGWRIDASNPDPVRGALRWRVEDPQGKPVIESREETLDLAAGPSQRRFEVPFQPARPGRHRLVCRWEPESQGIAYERSLDLWGVDLDRTLVSDGAMELELVEEIGCSENLPPEKLVESAPTKVVRASFGVYREAAPERNSRFAVRLKLPVTGCPYVVEWDYPDDKPRTMELISQTVSGQRSEYELQTGVFTGAEYPLSNRMKTHRCLYWPRDRDTALVFMTAEKDRPAAASAVRVFRVKGGVERAPEPDCPASPPAPPRRHVGIYFEDPALCYDFGNLDAMPGFETLADRLIAYMHYSGQDLLMYPGVWYQGPFYPSESQGTALQRPHPHNFIEYLLLRFEAENFQFLPTINLHSLPSLAGHKWRDDMMLTGEASAGPLSVGWDGGPNLTGWHGTRPNYNILHPEVRAAVLTMVDEMLDLYGDSPAFQGLCFHLTKHCMLWFGDLDGGYNDYCVEAFEKDTGIAVPVAADDPGRAPKRYRWIMANAPEPWIDWRCRALRAFYGEVAERIGKERPGLRLVLAMYRPVYRDVVPEPGFVGPDDFVRRINREGGLDPALYAGLPNVVFDRTLYPADYRWYRAHRSWEDDPKAIRELLTDGKGYAGWAAEGHAWVNLHDRYWEDAVGRRGDWKTFWGQEQPWRVSTLNPTGRYALESYLIPLAHADIMTFTKGGFLIGTHGMEPWLAEFSRAFRSLPAVPFTEMKGVPEPMTARFLQQEDGLYFYLVNPSPQAAELSLALEGKIAEIRDLANGAVQSSGKTLHLQMEPMSFRAFRIRGYSAAVQVN